MYPEYKSNYADQMQNYLLYQFQSSPNIKSYLAVYASQLQALELEYFQLLEALGIETAFGFALDVIGKEVGESRQGRNDADYRSGILTKIFINNASGTPEEVISATKQITGATRVNYTPQYPAGVALEILGAEYVSKAPTIKRTLPAGVDLIFTKDLGLDMATSYTGAVYSYIKTFESNPV